MTKYLEKLKDPRWEKKRLEILYRDNNICQQCGDSGNQIHHKEYLMGREPWDYPDEYLITLCHECHQIESSFVLWHRYEKFKKRIINGRNSKNYESDIKKICDLLLI
jgi:5-methylcytosine-specific restriction endonuclease McrA